MGASKTEVFTEAQNRIAKIAKAIGHPARVAIIEYLKAQKSCICKDIVEELPLSQPTISQHLRELKNAGLIQGSFEGATICYCLTQTALQDLSTFCNMMSQSLEESSTGCC